MAEEFQGGVCGGNWWPFNSSRNLFGPISPCNSSAVNDFGWLNHDLIMDMKTTTTRWSISDHDSAGSASDGSTSIAQKPSPNDWNIHDLLNDSGRILPEQNYSQEVILQESDGLNSSMNNNYQLQEQNPASNSFTNSACSFPLNSASYNFLQTLFDTDSQPEQADILINNHATNHDLQFTTNNTVIPFWNSSAPASFVPSLSQPQFIPSSHNTAKPNVHNFNSKHKREEAGIINGATKKASDEPAFKRQRIETPSPLPTFKVRKEKLGDRVTALQQLVSPFGKTDTASVLHEAIEYIKFLHDQVSVLSSPYLKNRSNSVQNQQVVIGNNIKHQERPIEDLRSRGLCVVPISSTFPVATETTSDFWTPTFGGSFR